MRSPREGGARVGEGVQYHSIQNVPSSPSSNFGRRACILEWDATRDTRRAELFTTRGRRNRRIAPHHLRVIVANASEDPVPGIKAKPSPKVLHLVAVRFAEFQIIEGCDAIPAKMQIKEAIGQRRIRSVARANARRRWDPPEFQQAGFPDRIVCGRFFKL